MKLSTICHGLFQVLHDGESGRLLVDRHAAQRGLAVSAMAGMLVTGRLTVVDGRVAARDRRPRAGDDPVSGFVLGAVAHRRTHQTPSEWANALGETVYEMVAGELVGSGVLRREESRRLLGRPVERFPVDDALIAALPRSELRHMVDTPRAFDLPGVIVVAVLLRLGIADVLGPGPAAAGAELLGDLLDHVPADLRALVTGLDPASPVPTGGGATWTQGPFAGSRFLVEAAVLERRGAEAGEPGGFDTGLDEARETEITPESAAAAEAAEAATRADQIAVLQARSDVAARLLSTRGAVDAVPLFEELAADCGHLLGHHHPDTLVAEGNLAVAYLSAERADVGVPLLITNLTDRESVFGDAHPLTLTVRDALAAVHRGSGRLIEALALARLVAAQRRHVLGDRHPDTLVSRLGLGLTHAATGDHGSAVGVLAPALQDALDSVGSGHPVTIALRATLADSHLVIGRTERARDGYRQALADAELTLGAHHPETVALRADLDALPPGPGAGLPAGRARTGGQAAGSTHPGLPAGRGGGVVAGI